ncbi:winged helix-turn-helix transcriptional regulator [Saccharopolyspora sp. HNM0983]|uniref:Winged helix-turn-helix transcriptional regulator n=1 Tax=Saccharopolyspora montiporae TaxID=2781240 RepID=A0A929FYG0_9PSEU|nr:winged helix-turn-helix domain-containing protein [Saccharopolyspora sp. HNM0983]MBE9373445.1 winged helix-turn-helix transcriptional regulator [Saccharopolyspora sp. HNM0983]
MVLRIHFTGQDLARTRLHRDPHPMWELVLSLHVLQSGSPLNRHQHWLRAARQRLGSAPHARADLRLLSTLVPPAGAFPDFLTPVDGTGPFEAQLDDVLSTPRPRRHAELGQVFGAQRAPAWVAAFADGEQGAARAVRIALQRYHELVLRPHADEIARCVLAEREARVRSLCTGGAEGLLASLPGCMRWEPPVLVADYPGPDRDLHLRGRGITLIPSYFCHGKPVGFVDAELPPVLVYPVGADVVPERAAVELGVLVGPTRAQVLRELRATRSTSELARRVGISVGAASKHAAVLRSAGLVHSVRERNTVLHGLTGRGVTVVSGHPPAESPLGELHPGGLVPSAG